MALHSHSHCYSRGFAGCHAILKESIHQWIQLQALTKCVYKIKPIPSRAMPCLHQKARPRYKESQMKKEPENEYGENARKCPSPRHAKRLCTEIKLFELPSSSCMQHARQAQVNMYPRTTNKQWKYVSYRSLVGVR